MGLVTDLLLPCSRWRQRQRIKGEVILLLDGLEVGRSPNLFVDGGYQRMARFLAGVSPAPPSYIAVGNGDGSALGVAVVPGSGDVALGFEWCRRPVMSGGVISGHTARLAATFLAGDAQRHLTEVGLFASAGDTGTVTSATTLTVTDTSKNWQVNQWVGAWIYILTGTAAGGRQNIIANTATQISMGSALAPAPAAADTYLIGPTDMFAHSSIDLTKGAQALTVIWQLTVPTP